jgi:hypothetical protein
MFEKFKPVEGLQLYEAPPLAERFVDEPLQIETSVPASAVNDEFTETTTPSVAVQPALVTVTV